MPAFELAADSPDLRPSAAVLKFLDTSQAEYFHQVEDDEEEEPREQSEEVEEMVR